MILTHVHSSDEPSCAKNTILSCRLVCKRLGNVGQGFAFQRINFLLDKIGCKRLVELSLSPLRKEVRELNCYFDPFGEKLASSREAFNNAHRFSDRAKAFEYCHRGYRFQCMLEKDHQHMSQLTAAVSRFHNLRAVKLSRAWQYYAERDDVCNSPTKLSKSAVGHWLFEAITDALAAAEIGIESLALGSFESSRGHIDDHGLVGTIQRISPDNYGKYGQAFRKLKTLKIHLSEDRSRLDDDDGDGWVVNYRGLSTLIRSAALLEELKLSFPMPCIPALPAEFLHSLDIPNLRILDLESTTFHEPSHLLRLLSKHASTLRTVHFLCLCLEVGSWETVFFGMRAALSITSISMRYFYTGDIDLEELCPGDRVTGFEQAVGHFIQKKTDTNPFDLLEPNLGEQFNFGLSDVDWDFD